MIWKEKYKIGVQLIDEQHKELFKRVSEFLFSVRSEGGWEEKLAKIKDTLTFMQEYVIIHFNAEEAYQIQINYPGYLEHKRIHEQFKAEVVQYAERFAKQGYEEELVQEFAGKLLAWLINHVAATDQQIGEYALEGEKKQ